MGMIFSPILLKGNIDEVFKKRQTVPALQKSAAEKPIGDVEKVESPDATGQRKTKPEREAPRISTTDRQGLIEDYRKNIFRMLL